MIVKCAISLQKAYRLLYLLCRHSGQYCLRFTSSLNLGKNMGFLADHNEDEENKEKSILSVLVYNGEGSGEESRELFVAALTQALDPTYHSVKYITAEEIKEGSWTKTCRVIAFGGGYDLGFIKAVGAAGTKVIKEFVEAGGAYLGICAGAYWACDCIEFDKGGPLQVVGERLLKFYPGCCVGPAFPGFQYNSKKGVHAVPILYKGGTSFSSYMHGGGFFAPVRKVLPKSCSALIDTTFTHGSAGHGSDGDEAPIHQDVSHDYLNGLPSNCHKNLNGLSSSTDSQASFPSNHCLSMAVPSSPFSSNHEPVTIEDSCAPSWSCIQLERKYRTDSLYEKLGVFTSLSENPAAIVRCSVGKGVAVLSGVHLEFPAALLDWENPELKSVKPELQGSEGVRDSVFRDLLEQLGLTLKPARSNL